MNRYLAADYIAALLDFLESRGIDAGPLLQGPSMPSVLTGHVAWDAVAHLAGAVGQELPPDRAALAFGLTLGITRHGILGYAARSSRSGLEGLMLDEQFMATRTDLFRFRVMAEPDWLTVIIDLDLSPADPGWRFLHLVMLGTLVRMYMDLHHGKLLVAGFTVPFPVPEVGNLPELARITWREEAGRFAVEGKKEILLERLATRDDTLWNLLVEQCRQAMPALDGEVQDSLVRTARGLLKNQLVDPPSVGELAIQLGLSERTLKRRLLEAGTSYRTLLTALRLEVACHYLQTTRLGVEDIAYRLGYTSPATFWNRFRAWSGCTPVEMRRRLSGGHNTV